MKRMNTKPGAMAESIKAGAIGLVLTTAALSMSGCDKDVSKETKSTTKVTQTPEGTKKTTETTEKTVETEKRKTPGNGG